MDLTSVIVLLGIGLFAGVVSSLMGVGGGIVVVPLLTLLYGMTQEKAAATSLAMLLPPIGIFAVMTYYNRGLIDLKVAGLLAVPFAVGALLGAKFVQPYLSDRWLRVLFSTLMVYAAVMVLWKSQARERAALLALGGAAVWIVGYGVLSALGRKWEREPETVGERYRRLRGSDRPPQVSSGDAESR